MHSMTLPAGPRQYGALVLLLSAACLTACGSSSDSGGSTKTVRAPSSAGDVWEVANPDERPAASGTLLAYVNGLHVFVLDGNDAYAGMSHLSAQRGPDGARILTLPNGVAVQLVSAGEGLELRFPGGETVPLRKQAERRK
jgi:hypothetical protein